MPSSWSVPRSVAMNPNILDTLATGEPQSIALAGVDGRALTFAEMGDEVRRLAGQLHTLGIRPNDRIGIVLENGADAALTFLAVASCATAAPLNDAYRE